MMSIVGLVLAVVGVFYPITLLVLGIPASVGLGIAARDPFRRASRELISGGILPVAAVLVILITAAGSAAFFSAEHVMTDRDPGVYLTSSRWLADEGTLLVSGTIGGFADIDGVTAASPGYYEVRDDGTLDPQFLHLVPVWGAAAHFLGGDQALFRVNALVIALALGALWLFASTIMRPWFAVLATASIAVLMPTVHFARDLYSEPLALLFGFAGFAFLTFARRVEHGALSLLAGLMAAAMTMVRIDGWIVVIAVIAYLMAVWWRANEASVETTVTRFVHPALLGVLISSGVGLLDALVRTRQYMIDHGQQVVLMFGLLAVIASVGLLALRRPGPFRRLETWLEDNRRTIAWSMPVGVIGLAAALYSIRPLVQETHAASLNSVVLFVQRSQGLVVDGTRTYNEWSMHWLSWYLGVLGLGLAVIGLAWVWRRAILGLRGVWPFLLTLSLMAAGYLLRPSITPDQLWAMRRFLPIVLPGLILTAVLGVQWLFEEQRRVALRSAAVGVAVGLLIVVPALYTWPLATSTSYVGMYDALEDVCDAIPQGSAVLMAGLPHSAAYQAPVRSFCRVPVAGSYVEDPTCAIISANKAWADRGVNLIIGYGDQLGLNPDVRVSARYELPEATLTRRPAQRSTGEFTINLVDADSVAGRC